MIEPREIMWRRVMDEMSFERAQVRSGPLGPELSGLVLVSEKGAPLQVEYRIQCDEYWKTREVQFDQIYLGRRKNARLSHDGAGHWQRDGHVAPELAGCTDIDLAVTPSTNALAINRLDLQHGGVASIRAAWARFPAFDVVPADQRYERLAEHKY